MIIYNRTEYKALSQQKYSKEKNRLQVELLKLQEWVINSDKRVAIVLEGRDAAGKGSTIKRFIENMMPKGVEVIELGVPTKKQEKNWFRTWEKRMPESGKIHFFDRSWYSRALIQPVMGFFGDLIHAFLKIELQRAINALTLMFPGQPFGEMRGDIRKL